MNWWKLICSGYSIEPPTMKKATSSATSVRPGQNQVAHFCKGIPHTWPWSSPLLPPNIISLCSPWLPKNGMQGYFSIYCRLFPPGASSNSLRNLLESTLVAITISFKQARFSSISQDTSTVRHCTTEWHLSLEPCSFSYRLLDESQEHESLLFQQQVLFVSCFGHCLSQNSHRYMLYMIPCLLGVR